MNLFNIANAFERNRIRNWPTVYFAIDIHDTIGKGTYKKDNEGFEFYPWAKEVLQNLTSNPKTSLILYTASHMEPARNIQLWLATHDIHILDINGNPDHQNNDLCDFSKKFYFDVLLDDKAGFEGWKDWFLIMKELQRIGQWEFSKSHAEKMKVVHAIWLAAGNEVGTTEIIMKKAAEILKTTEDELFKGGWNKDYLDRAWCSRPLDWKPEDSQKYLSQ